MDVGRVLLGEVRERHLIDAAHVVAPEMVHAAIEIDHGLRRLALRAQARPVVALLEQPSLHRLGLADERLYLDVMRFEPGDGLLAVLHDRASAHLGVGEGQTGAPAGEPAPPDRVVQREDPGLRGLQRHHLPVGLRVGIRRHDRIRARLPLNGGDAGSRLLRHVRQLVGDELPALGAIGRELPLGEHDVEADGEGVCLDGAAAASASWPV